MEIKSSPFWKAVKPLLGSINALKCRSGEGGSAGVDPCDWCLWLCWGRFLWIVFRGWFLGDIFKITAKAHSENVNLGKSDLKMSAPEKWMRKDLMKLLCSWASFLSNRLAAVFCYTKSFVTPLVLETKGSIPGGIPDIVAWLFTRFYQTAMGNLEFVPHSLHFPLQLCHHPALGRSWELMHGN